MKKIVIALLFFLPAIIFAQADKVKKHPIDKWLEECLEKSENQTTIGMVICADTAYVKWDKELNKIYKELLNKLGPNDQKLLKEAQRAWLKFRDEEFKLLLSIYSQKEGTMYHPIHIFDRIEVVKQRVLELKNILDLINNERLGE